MNHLLTLIVLAGSLMTAGQPAAADPGKEFERGHNLFLYQDYEKAVNVLKPLLYPEILLPSEEKVIKCREYLGASYWFQKNYNKFEDEFLAVLLKNPSFQLDAFYYPVEMIEDLKQLKQRLIGMKIIIPGKKVVDPKKKDDDKVKPIIKIVEKKIFITERPVYPVFMPFGVPQFYNGHMVKGTIILVMQTLGLTVNIGSYLIIQLYRDGKGYTAGENINTANNLATALYTGLGVFAALYLYSVIDGYIYYKKQKTTVVSMITGPDGAGYMTLLPLLSPSPGGGQGTGYLPGYGSAGFGTSGITW